MQDRRLVQIDHQLETTCVESNGHVIPKNETRDPKIFGAQYLRQVNFTRARGPGFDSWTDPSKIARPQDSHVVTCPAGGAGKNTID